MFCKRFLTQTGRQLHTSVVVNKSLGKPLIIVNIEHEFHKILKWQKPEKLVPWDPRRSGDLRPLEDIDPTWLKVEYRPFADVINKLPEEHRRLFTVEFGAVMDGPRVLLADSLDKVKRHKYDNSSLEVKIARCTWLIRWMQEDFKNNPRKTGKGYLRNKVKELVDARNRFLKMMREQDYKRFEWIIEVLGLIYKLDPPLAKVQRKPAVDVIVALYCNEIREKKMAEYKAQLEEEKIPFLRRKLDTLQAIRTDELSVGLSSSVDDEIRSTRRLILELENKQGKNMTIHPVPQNQGDAITN